MYIKIFYDGKEEMVEGTITLHDAQQFVGGFVEVIKLPCKKFMLVDEDARCKANYPSENVKASNIAGLKILGNVVILDKMSNLKG